MGKDKTIHLPANPTPHDAYKELEPTVLQMIRLISTCPLSPGGQTGLAFCVTSAFFVCLCDMELVRQGRPRKLRSNIMREMADLLVDALSDDAEPNLALVPALPAKGHDDE